MTDLKKYNKERQEMIEARRQKAEGTISEAQAVAYIGPQTPKEKMENFWYHYKWFVVVGVALAILITIVAIQMFNRPEFDASVIVASEKSLEGLEPLLEPGFEGIVEDYDQNGEKRVEVSIFKLGAEEGEVVSPQVGQMNYAKLTGRVTNRKDFIFLLDEVGYDFLTNLGMEFEDVSAFTGSDESQGDRFFLEGTTAAQQIHFQNTGEDLFLCFADFDTYPEKLKSDPEYQKIHEIQREYFEKLIASVS